MSPPANQKLPPQWFPDLVQNVAEKLKIIPAKDSKRVMRFPYTTGAQVAQFPYRFYWNNNWLFRYWIIACFASWPVFRWISKMANSPENKKKWAESKAKEAAEHH